MASPDFSGTVLFKHFIQRARFRRRAAALAQLQHAQRDDLAAHWQGQHIADADIGAGLFYALAVQPDTAGLGLFLSDVARLAEARVEQPLVDAERLAQALVDGNELSEPGKRGIRLGRVARSLAFGRPGMFRAAPDGNGL